MGKRRGRKRKKKHYNKKQFANILCSTCKVCSSFSKGPDFCYTMYKSNPDNFFDLIYVKLLRIFEWNIINGQEKIRLNHDGNNSFTISISGFEGRKSREMFSNLFCGSCTLKKKDISKNGSKCEWFDSCFKDFVHQMASSYTSKENYEKFRKNKKRKKDKYICTPYPTFFCNDDNKKWVDTIGRIINNTYGKNSKPNNIKQNKNTRTVGAIDAGSDK